MSNINNSLSIYFSTSLKVAPHSYLKCENFLFKSKCEELLLVRKDNINNKIWKKHILKIMQDRCNIPYKVLS